MILGYILFGVFIKNHRLPVRTGNRQAAKYVLSSLEKRVQLLNNTHGANCSAHNAAAAIQLMQLMMKPCYRVWNS